MATDDANRETRYRARRDGGAHRSRSGRTLGRRVRFPNTRPPATHTSCGPRRYRQSLALCRTQTSARFIWPSVSVTHSGVRRSYSGAIRLHAFSLYLLRLLQFQLDCFCVRIPQSCPQNRTDEKRDFCVRVCASVRMCVSVRVCWGRKRLTKTGKNERQTLPDEASA